MLPDLPYRIVVPLPVRATEAPDLSEHEWQALDDAGMITYDLTPEEVAQALLLKVCHPGLSANDCCCLVTARAYSGILLTGDALLRRVAIADGLQVHGVLWVVDELEAAGIRPQRLLVRALKDCQADDSVYLPASEIAVRLNRLS